MVVGFHIQALSRSAKDLTLGAFVLGVSAAAVFVAVDREFILDAMDLCGSDPSKIIQLWFVNIS